MRIPLGSELRRVAPSLPPLPLPEPELPFPASATALDAPGIMYPADGPTEFSFLYGQLQNVAFLGGTNTWSGRQSFTGTPAADTSHALIEVGNGVFGGGAGTFAGAASGTFLGINASAGISRFFDFQVAGVSKANLGPAGNLVIAGSLTAPGNLNVFSGAPQAQAGLALVEIGAGGFAGGAGNFSGSAAGTHLGINAAAGYTGDFANFEVNGSSFYKVTNAGDVTAAGRQSFTGAPTADTSHALIEVGNGVFGGGAGTFAGAASGTYLAINAAAGISRFIEFQVAGVTKANLGPAGNLLLAGNITAQGNLNVFSAAPQAQAGLALVEIGAGGFAGGVGDFAGSASGTHLGINAAAGFGGRFCDFQVAGVSFFRVSAAGNLTWTGGLTHQGTTAGFFGTTPVSRPSVSAAATDAGTTQTLANSLRTALLSLGLAV